MSYQVQFVGLVCFLREDGLRTALLPDGSKSNPPHVTKIAVDSSTIVKSGTKNWGGNAKANGDFLLTEPSIIKLEKADTADPAKPLDTKEHKLVNLPAGFKISTATAKTIAQVPVRRGTLQTFRYPGTKNVPTASILTQLDVPHEGNIHITVTSQNGATVRTIELLPGTEIAILNDLIKDPAVDPPPHFRLYEKLGSGAALSELPPPIPSDLHRSQSTHRVFGGAGGADPTIDGVNCPNTGCCG